MALGQSLQRRCPDQTKVEAKRKADVAANLVASAPRAPVAPAPRSASASTGVQKFRDLVLSEFFNPGRKGLGRRLGRH